MSPDPDPGLPTAKGLGSQFLHWGVPLLAGVGGFFMGDVWGVRGFLEPWIGPVLESAAIPFESRLDYRAFAAAAVYGVAAAIVAAIFYKYMPKAGLMRVIAKTVGFYLGGTTARMVLSGLAPNQIGGSITLPAVVR